MGVKISHGCYNGSCGTFNQWRYWIGEQIGFSLKIYGQGYCGSSPCVPWSLISHPIKPLLDHSDCDGFLSPKECICIYHGLVDIVRNVHRGGIGEFADISDSKEKIFIDMTMKFARGCIEAFEKNENVIFS